MINLTQKVKFLVCSGGVAMLALTATPAQAITFVSTFRPTGIGPVRPLTTEVGSVDAAGNYSTIYTSELQLTDIALSATNELFGINYTELYRLPYGTPAAPVVGGQIGVGSFSDGTNSIFLNGLGFDNNNNLYAIGGLDANGPRPSGERNINGFFRLNTTTGRATLISTLDGLTPSAFTLGGDASDIVFNPNPVSASNPDGGRFFATTRNNDSVLFSIGLDGSPIRVIGNTGKDKVAGLTFENGNLFGYTADRNRVQLNLLTGATTSVASLQSDVLSPRFGEALNIGGAASTAATAVPEPSSAAGFVFLGVCFGAHKIMKRKQKLED
jgi:hypothetical protein